MFVIKRATTATPTTVLLPHKIVASIGGGSEKKWLWRSWLSCGCSSCANGLLAKQQSEPETTTAIRFPHFSKDRGGEREAVVCGRLPVAENERATSTCFAAADTAIAIAVAFVETDDAAGGLQQLRWQPRRRQFCLLARPCYCFNMS